MGFKLSRAKRRRAPRRPTIVAAVAITVGIFGNAIGGNEGGRSGGLSQEVDARVSQYVASWNTHDSRVLADYFTADADMIMGNGPILSGRAAIEGWWRDYFAVQEPERELTIEMQSTRAIAGDVALVNVLTTTGGRTAQGLDLPARKARGTWVLVRQDGSWLISAIRGMPTQQDRIIRGGDGTKR